MLRYLWDMTPVADPDLERPSAIVFEVGTCLLY